MEQILQREREMDHMFFDSEKQSATGCDELTQTEKEDVRIHPIINDALKTENSRHFVVLSSKNKDGVVPKPLKQHLCCRCSADGKLVIRDSKKNNMEFLQSLK